MCAVSYAVSYASRQQVVLLGLFGSHARGPHYVCPHTYLSNACT